MLSAAIAAIAASMPLHARSAGNVPPLSMADVLHVPEITAMLAGPDGTLAWVERIGGAWNIRARRHDGETRQLTSYAGDDPAPIRLLAYIDDGRQLLFSRGDSLNTRNRPIPRRAELLSVEIGGNQLVPPPVEAWPGSSTGNDGTGNDIEFAVASPDGETLAFVRGGDLWAGNSRRQAPLRPLITGQGEITFFSWSPDARRIAFVSNRAAEGRGFFAYVGVYDVGDETITYLAPGVGVDFNPVWSADGNRVAFVRCTCPQRSWRFSATSDGPPFSIVVADSRNGDEVFSWTAPAGQNSFFPAFGIYAGYFPWARHDLFWMADGSLVFPYEKTGFRALYRIQPSAAGSAPTRLTAGNLEIAGAVQSQDRTRIAFWSPTSEDPHRLRIFQMSLDKEMAPVPVDSPSPNHMQHAALYVDASALAYLEGSNREPERLMLHTDGESREVLSTPPGAAEKIASLMPEGEIVRFSSEDESPVYAVLYRSRQSGHDARGPLIVHAHGGPRDKAYPIWQGFFGYPPVLRYFLSRGYHVMSVNYRGGTGYGLRFREPERYGAIGTGDVEDFVAAANFAADNLPFVDAGKLIAYGHSYGGHIAASALARANVFAGGISSAGISDWVHEMKSDSGGPLPLRIPLRLDIKKPAYENSAIARVGDWGTEPILFLHGDADRSAAMDQTAELYLQLLNRGHEPRAVIFPGEGHALRDADNQRKYIAAIEAFFVDHGLAPTDRPRTDQEP